MFQNENIVYNSYIEFQDLKDLEEGSIYCFVAKFTNKTYISKVIFLRSIKRNKYGVDYWYEFYNIGNNNKFVVPDVNFINKTAEIYKI